VAKKNWLISGPLEESHPQPEEVQAILAPQIRQGWRSNWSAGSPRSRDGVRKLAIGLLIHTYVQDH
jgi:hypothetical protein